MDSKNKQYAYATLTWWCWKHKLVLAQAAHGPDCSISFLKDRRSYVTVTMFDPPRPLDLDIKYCKTSKHNWGHRRYDFWFEFDGNVWHGVQIGEGTMSAVVKRTKKTKWGYLNEHA